MKSDTPKTSRQEQAADWFAADRAGMMLVEDRARFEAWLEDPRNRAAFESMQDLWKDLEVLKASTPIARARRKIWPLAAVAALTVVILGGVAGSLLLGSGDARTIATLVGQQETQSMPDGSLIAVNVSSALTYKVSDSERRVVLSEGEAAFTVRADAAKPFVVRAGDYEVRAIGTAFNVKQREGVLQVGVSEGVVEVCRVLASGRIEVLSRLSAGQVLALPLTENPGLAAPAPKAVPPDQISEWRMRIVTYEDVAVGQIVDDFNRYFDRKLRVEQPNLRERRVTILLKVDDRERAIETLAGLLDASVQRTATDDQLLVK